MIIDSIIAAVIVGGCSIIAVYISFLLSRKKIQEIHVLVNNRLDEALQEIVELKKEAEKHG